MSGLPLLKSHCRLLRAPRCVSPALVLEFLPCFRRRRISRTCERPTEWTRVPPPWPRDLIEANRISQSQIALSTEAARNISQPKKIELETSKVVDGSPAEPKNTARVGKDIVVRDAIAHAFVHRTPESYKGWALSFLLFSKFDKRGQDCRFASTGSLRAHPGATGSFRLCMTTCGWKANWVLQVPGKRQLILFYPRISNLSFALDLY